MKELLPPWQLLLLVLAGWVNRQQQDVVEYLLAENRILRQKLGKKRILLTEEQRRCLAIKGKILGRKMLEQVVGIVTLSFAKTPAALKRLTFHGLMPDTLRS